MKSLIAFNTDTQAYVLPITTTTLGAVVISQPRYIPNALSVGVPRIKSQMAPHNWVEDCQKSDQLSSPASRQKLYCWWMSLSAAEKEHIYNESIV